MNARPYSYSPLNNDSSEKLVEHRDFDGAGEPPVDRAEHAAAAAESVDFLVCSPVWLHVVPFIGFANGAAAAFLLGSLIKQCFERGRKDTHTADYIGMTVCAGSLAVFATLYRRSHVAPLAGREALYDPTRARFQYIIKLGRNPRWVVAWFFFYGWSVQQMFSEFAQPWPISAFVFTANTISLTVLAVRLAKRPLRRLRSSSPA